VGGSLAGGKGENVISLPLAAKKKKKRRRPTRSEKGIQEKHGVTEKEKAAPDLEEADTRERDPANEKKEDPLHQKKKKVVSFSQRKFVCLMIVG